MRNFAQSAVNVWVVGQTLSHVSNNEEDFLLDEIAGRRGGKVRVLFMRRIRGAIDPNPAMSLFTEWSPNPAEFESQVSVSEGILFRWLGRAQMESWDLEVRQLDMVPFSANLVDWTDPDDAAVQERPQLFRTSSTRRPVIEFTRRCEPETFDVFVDTMEAAWEAATPLRGTTP